LGPTGPQGTAGVTGPTGGASLSNWTPSVTWDPTSLTGVTVAGKYLETTNEVTIYIRLSGTVPSDNFDTNAHITLPVVPSQMVYYDDDIYGTPISDGSPVSGYWAWGTLDLTSANASDRKLVLNFSGTVTNGTSIFMSLKYTYPKFTF
jgi:hypothetical protein